MRDFAVLDAVPPRAKSARPVSAFFTAAVLASALAAICCGAIVLAAHLHHHARPRVALHPEWFVGPVATERGFARLEEGRP